MVQKTGRVMILRCPFKRKKRKNRNLGLVFIAAVAHASFIGRRRKKTFLNARIENLIRSLKKSKLKARCDPIRYEGFPTTTQFLRQKKKKSVWCLS